MVQPIILVLVLACFFASLMKALRQPLLLGYIVAGMVISFLHAHLGIDTHQLEVFAKLGIIFLLFVVGLQLNPRAVHEVGKVAIITGLGQVVFTALISFVLALLFGMPVMAALYVAMALTFSSTIIVLKLLTDKKDLEKMYARVAIGVLLVQDVVATVVLLGLTLGTSIQGSSAVLPQVFIVVGKALALGSGLIILSRLVRERLIGWYAQHAEALFLFGLAWSGGVAMLFALAGLSLEIGALFAGVSLASTAYATELAARLRPLRDFCILIFFVVLGSQLQVGDLPTLVVPALVLSLFVLIGNPIIVIILMNILGYGRRDGFHVGLTVAQISEFSLVLMALGLQLGHVPPHIASLVTVVGLVTISGSTYLILYSEWWYRRLSRFLHLLEFRRTTKARQTVLTIPTALLVGYDRAGPLFLESVAALGLQTLVIDQNAINVERAQRAGALGLVADVAELEVLDELDLSHIRVIISTIPDERVTAVLMEYLRRSAPAAIRIGMAHHVEVARVWHQHALDFVHLPHYAGAYATAQFVLRAGFDRGAYHQEAEKQLQQFERAHREHHKQSVTV